MSGNGVDGDVWSWWGGGGAKGLVGMEESIHSMGLVWREARILAQMVYNPIKGYFNFYFDRHTCADKSLYML
jgi:hypothetical protein